jgi:hypothetical protein
MTQIKYFNSIRVGNDFPISFDITEPGTISCIFAEIYLYSLPAVQLLKKDNNMALFVFKYGEEQIVPEWWKDAEVVWKWENPRGFENL